jgi:hypothetical protein
MRWRRVMWVLVGLIFLLLVLAGGLFLGHWRWLRRRGDDPTAAV